MISVEFSLQNSHRKMKILRKIFLLVNTSIEVALKMIFLFFSNADVEFATRNPI